MLIPLTANGAYGGPDGMSNVFFDVAGSATCGIRVSDVNDSNLEGLMFRDDPLQLNPNAESMRLKIEVGTPSTSCSSRKLICVRSWLVTRPS